MAVAGCWRLPAADARPSGVRSRNSACTLARWVSRALRSFVSELRMVGGASFGPPAAHRVGPARLCASVARSRLPPQARRSMGRPTASPRADRRRLERAAPSRRSAWGSLPALLWPGRARPRGDARGLAAAARARRADAGSALGPGGPMVAHVVETATAPHCGTSALLPVVLAVLLLAHLVSRALRVRARSSRGVACRCGLGPAAARDGALRAKHTGCSCARGRCVERLASTCWEIPPRRSCESSLAREPAGGACVGRWAAAQRPVSSFAGPGGKRCDVLCAGVGLCVCIVCLCLWVSSLDLERRPAGVSPSISIRVQVKCSAP